MSICLFWGEQGRPDVTQNIPRNYLNRHLRLVSSLLFLSCLYPWIIAEKLAVGLGCNQGSKAVSVIKLLHRA